jgi:imidazolonepropionase-like amidohydrolase
VLPKGLIDYYRSEEGGWFLRLIEREEGVKLTMKTHERKLARIGRIAKYLADRDGKLLFGTDTPSSPTYANPPGYNGYLEMKRWVSGGVPLPKLLNAATLANARALKLEGTLGSIEPGKVANLLLLAKDPYESIEAYDSIETVILRGRALARPELEARN